MVDRREVGFDVLQSVRPEHEAVTAERRVGVAEHPRMVGAPIPGAELLPLEDAATAELRLEKDARELEVVVERFRRLVGTMRDARFK